MLRELHLFDDDVVDSITKEREQIKKYTRAYSIIRPPPDARKTLTATMCAVRPPEEAALM